VRQQKSSLEALLMAVKEKVIMLFTFVCNRCGHKWNPRAPKEPKVCPKCKSPYWNKPRVFKQNLNKKDKRIRL
jgi:predicted Zn-ribbon and HTH transcriptional regulator